jgi:hypothetical protein
MGSRQIVLVSTAGFSVRNTGIFWQEAKTKRLFSQCPGLVVQACQAKKSQNICVHQNLGTRQEFPVLKGLSHEIDFKKF